MITISDKAQEMPARLKELGAVGYTLWEGVLCLVHSVSPWRLAPASIYSPVDLQEAFREGLLELRQLSDGGEQLTIYTLPN